MPTSALVFHIWGESRCLCSAVVTRVLVSREWANANLNSPFLCPDCLAVIKEKGAAASSQVSFSSQ